jgi:hypothetical protein
MFSENCFKRPSSLLTFLMCVPLFEKHFSIFWMPSSFFFLRRTFRTFMVASSLPQIRFAFSTDSVSIMTNVESFHQNSTVQIFRFTRTQRFECRYKTKKNGQSFVTLSVSQTVYMKKTESTSTKKERQAISLKKKIEKTEGQLKILRTKLKEIDGTSDATDAVKETQTTTTV